MNYMEILRDNFLLSSAAIRVNSGTDSAANLYDRNPNTEYASSGYDSNTSTLISVEFSVPTLISHVLLLNNNFKKLRLFYNSLTANTFTPDFNTSTSDQTNLYIQFASITVNSISLQIDTCFTTSVEKTLGELVVTERWVQFDQNPDAKKYKPVIERMSVEHKMPDGGISQYNIKDKLTLNMEFSYITNAFYSKLESVFNAGRGFYFIPFPTTTSWDAKAYPVVWSGNFNFTYADNNINAGYSGKILFKEMQSSG